MWKPLKLTFILIVSSIALAPTMAKECSDIYLEAKNLCERTSRLCTELTQCKDLRNSCNSDLSTMAGCEQLELCAADQSPQIHDQRCQYKWWGSAQNGTCFSKNISSADVSYLCPGFSGRKDSQYNDTEFNCNGQVKYYDNIVESCGEAIRGYYKQCANTDVDRAFLMPKPCQAAKDGPVLLTDREDIQIAPVSNIERTTSVAQENSGLGQTASSRFSNTRSTTGVSR